MASQLKKYRGVELKELKDRVIKKLRANGVKIQDTSGMPTISRCISRLTGKTKPEHQTAEEYMQSYLDVPDPPKPKPCGFVPQKATAPDWGHRKEWEPEVHPRAAEIDALDRPISMSHVGNGNNFGYRRGR